MTTLTPEQKKDRIKVTALGALLGSAITFIILRVVYKKHIDKLEAKIYKLEGWQ